jgi:NADH:ubiquinone oxidoreductase subunit 5 (subunit L)/multisubunit Na+/H+ antiporter MnhA subunit
MVIIGALTAFFAASTALLQTDLKKIIAYSTCSQLGYMLVACGLSKYGIALFHLMLHGFFKALLFLVAGAILHSMNDVQETRYYRKLMYFITDYLSFLFVGSFSLGGLVCFGGYYSKDLIIFSSVLVLKSQLFGYFIYFLLVVTAIFTIVYSFSIVKLFLNPEISFFSYILNNTNKLKLNGHSYLLFIRLAILYLSF